MKKFLVAALLVLSTQSFAKVAATDAVRDLFIPGVYTGTNYGEDCSVKISLTDASAHIIIKNAKSDAGFVLLNESSTYSVDEVTGEISASQSMNFPRYINGGTRFLNIKEKNGVAQVYIATVAFDHKGNDISTYNACSVEL